MDIYGQLFMLARLGQLQQIFVEKEHDESEKPNPDSNIIRQWHGDAMAVAKMVEHLATEIAKNM